MIKQLITFLTLFGFSVGLGAQEITRPLKVSAEVFEDHISERNYEEREARTERDGALELPFVDDFSRFSLPTNNPDIPLDWQMWEDNSSRINNTLCKNAPTQGVATLDGLDRTGYPYDFFNEFAYGNADTLTSCPINLGGLTAADSVKLVFHYQRGGFGNTPEFQDSLVLEMTIGGTNPPLWQYVWSTPGGALQEDFEREFVHISDPNLLHPDAQFRFRNFATLSGNVDHWNIDYIWLDDNIIDSEFRIIDVAVSSHESSMLNTYQSMPWDHYQTNPAGFMDDDQFVVFSNLDDDRNISFDAEVYFDGAIQADLPQLSSTAENAMSFLNRQLSINDGSPNNYVFDPNVADTCADFQVRYVCTTSPDINSANDTLIFNQHFGNYYAYDDGSAEGAYALNEAGSATAMKFTNHVTDTLLGLLIHFSPFAIDNSDEFFILRAWADEGGTVGEQIEEQFNSHSPAYFSDGYDKFEFYEYDSPIEIPVGEFYVGMVQSTDAELNVGYDKHNDVNTEKLFYKLGAAGTFLQSGIEGALMIRPVFKSTKELIWDFTNVEEELEEQNPLTFYPNPAKDYISSNQIQNGETLLFYNSLGSLVLEQNVVSGEIYVGDLPKGVYLIQVLSNGSLKESSRFIKH